MSHQGEWENHSQGEGVQVTKMSSYQEVREMRTAEMELNIIQNLVTREPCDTETVTHGSEGDGWKSVVRWRHNSLAAYPTARPVWRGLGGNVHPQGCNAPPFHPMIASGFVVRCQLARLV